MHIVIMGCGRVGSSLARQLGRAGHSVAVIDREDSMVDVTKLSFCDVASAHLILTARRTIPVTVTGATGSVERVFDLVDVLKAHGLHRPRSPIQSSGAIGVSVWW